jgi:hypothetical protein
MAVTLNASTSSGFIQTADTSGVLTLQSNGTDALSVSSSNLQFNSGYGSVATAYGCRAWVNFDGTTNTAGFCTIRGSGGVTSVADNGAGNYTINFSFTMPDVNYTGVVTNSSDNLAPGSGNTGRAAIINNLTTTSARVGTVNSAGTASDFLNIYAVFLR